MKIASHGNFQAGMVDDPSREDKGGFEYAGGMDIFSEPGVLKANNAMTEVTYGASATPADVPRWMVDTTDASNIRAYIVAGDKILESTDGTTWNLFLTNGQGSNLGLGIWAGYVVYPSATKIGRTLVGNAAGKDDSYITTLDSDTEFHPIVPQGGTLKIGAGRYIASLDESFNFTARAMKLTTEYRVRCLAEYMTNLFMGTRIGAATGSVLNSDSSVFAWRGTVLSSGSALPDTPFPMKLRGMNALISDGRRLHAFPDRQGDILIYDGAGFPEFRSMTFIKNQVGLTVQPGAVTQARDNSILFSGEITSFPGIFQMKDGAICQSFVPAGFTPGENAACTIGFVKTSFNGIVLVGYYKNSDGSYHIEKSTGNKQNNAQIRTLWHKERTDKPKRWYGVKLNLKPMAANTVVTVSYRTERDAAFTSVSQTITPSTQDKPILLPVQPRSREIQWKFVYTTSTTNTPELLSYENLFDPLNSAR